MERDEASRQLAEREAQCAEMRRAMNAVLDWASSAHLPKPEPEAITELRKAVVFVDAGKALHAELVKLRAVAEAATDIAENACPHSVTQMQTLRARLDALKEKPL